MYDESTAFIIQNHGLRDFCKITLRRQGEELVVRNETLEEFTKQSKFVCWLDGYMLVKEEEGSKLSVIDERTKVKTYLPSPPSKSTHETFTMLYDVGYEILRIENDDVDSKWVRKRDQDGLWDWEKYLSEHVTVSSRYVYRDVMSRDFIVKLNSETEEFTKVKLLSNNVTYRLSEETKRTRFLFESRQNLVVLYDIDIPKTTNEITQTKMAKACFFNSKEFNCYDLKAKVVKLIEGVKYKGYHKWVPQVLSFSFMQSRVERLRELKKENKDRREVKKVFDL
ncbi:hypothetical protein Tco_0002854 [Tanacetum coccineum]